MIQTQDDDMFEGTSNLGDDSNSINFQSRIMQLLYTFEKKTFIFKITITLTRGDTRFQNDGIVRPKIWLSKSDPYSAVSDR